MHCAKEISLIEAHVAFLCLNSRAMYKNLNLGAIGHSLPFDQACSLAAKYNFAGIDLDLGYMGNIAKEQSLQAAKNWFAATGLKPGAIGVSVRWRESDSEEAFQGSLDKFAEEVNLASALGSTRCTTWVMPRSSSHDFYAHWDVTVPRLQKVARILADHGMWLGLEFVGPATLRSAKYDFIHTMDGMRAYAAAAGMNGNNNTGLLLDAFHWYTAHASLADLEFLDPKEIVYVHVNDAVSGRSADEQVDQERDMVGATGVIDIKGFIAVLKKIDYDGPVTVEPFNKGVREMSTEDAVKYTSESLDKVL